MNLVDTNPFILFDKKKEKLAIRKVTHLAHTSWLCSWIPKRNSGRCSYKPPVHWRTLCQQGNCEFLRDIRLRLKSAKSLQGKGNNCRAWISTLLAFSLRMHQSCQFASSTSPLTCFTVPGTGAPMSQYQCKLASLTAGVAPVKSPKDHVATHGPDTAKVHHGTQRAGQVVVHLTNTRASNRKELPAALRRSSSHESSADWLTAMEQRDKNIAAACLCLFSFGLFSLVLSSVLFSLLSCSLFYSFCLGSCSVALTLLLLLLVLLFSSPLFSLLFSFETLLSSSSWIVLRAFFRSLLLVHEFSFPSSIVESAADVSSSSAPSSNLRVYSGSLSSEAPHFFTDTSPSGLFSSSPSWLLWFLKYSSAHPSVHWSVACHWWRWRPY